MSRDPATAAEAGADRQSGAASGILAAAPRSLDRETAVLAAGMAALVTVALGTTLRILRNLPFEPIDAPESVRAAIVVGTPLALALALVAVALASTRPAVRVGLLFAGVFGLLASVDAAVTLPVAVAVTAGGGVAVLGGTGRPTSPRDARRTLLAAAFVVGVAVSLAGAVGVAGGGARAPGSLLVLAAIAATGLCAADDRVALVGGAVAFVAVVAASTANPYVAGSALLVGFAVVGAPNLLVGLAVAGGVTAAVAGLRRHEYALAVGAGLLLLAGMPATLPRAMAVLLGVTLVLVDAETLVAPRGAGEVTP